MSVGQCDLDHCFFLFLLLLLRPSHFNLKLFLKFVRSNQKQVVAKYNSRGVKSRLINDFLAVPIRERLAGFFDGCQGV